MYMYISSSVNPDVSRVIQLISPTARCKPSRPARVTRHAWWDGFKETDRKPRCLCGFYHQIAGQILHQFPAILGSCTASQDRRGSQAVMRTGDWKKFPILWWKILCQHLNGMQDRFHHLDVFRCCKNLSLSFFSDFATLNGVLHEALQGTVADSCQAMDLHIRWHTYLADSYSTLHHIRLQ